jgi:transcriptional regulator with XRE-family HTH domain
MMPERGSLTMGRRRVASELRRLRELANLTGDEVAEQLGWSGSKVSRIELNRIGVKFDDLTRLLDLYGVGGTQRDELLALTKAPRSRGWWEAYSDVVTAEYAGYLELESEAVTALCWSAQLVHGLLQTEDYARAAMVSHVEWMPVTPSGRIRRLIEVRLARQRLMSERGSLALSVVLDESVLLRKMGQAQVMRKQLDHLVDVSRLPNVTVRVLPLDGAHPIGTGSFTVLTFPPLPGIEPPADAVYLEQLARNAVYADKEDEAYQYRVAFERLTTESLNPEESRERIARVARETWS